jgi:hypothetical protein
MDQIEWCNKQKSGITVVEPNQNMAEDYFIKADNSLSMANTAKTNDWKAIGLYYACYDSLYALLQKAGVKCEIHECSIVLMGFFGFFESEINFVKELKGNRKNAQYYVDREFKVEDFNKVKDFILKCRELFHRADFKRIRTEIIQAVKPAGI